MSIRRVLVSVALALGMACGLLFVLGSMRYGGAEGLVRRMRAEIDAHQAHPSFVPTPLPTSTESQVGGLSPTDYIIASATPEAISASISAPTPTVTPTPTSTVSPSGTPPAAATAAPATNPTVLPTVASTATPPPTLSPAHRPAASSMELTGFAHEWQTWNNCGPATLAMDLSYFGYGLTQSQVGAVLRPNQEDKNVSPEEMADFARDQGLQALVRVNGDAHRLRLLLSNGLPVLTETWLEPEPGNGMGHYRLLTGYDDARQEWIAFDAYVSEGLDRKVAYGGIRVPYDEVAPLWAVFNRTYLLIYPDELAPVVQSILGADTDEAAMWQRALSTAQQEIEHRPDDAFAWFNLGTDLAALARPEEAAAAYDRARTLGLPWRMLWYQFAPFRAYYETGRYGEVLALADATFAVTEDIEELHYWKGLALRATGDLAGARQAFERAVALNPRYAEAQHALEAAVE